MESRTQQAALGGSMHATPPEPPPVHLSPQLLVILITSHFSWDFENSWWSVAIQWTDVTNLLQAVGYKAFSAIFWSQFSIIVLSITICLWVAYNFKTGTFPFVWPIKFVRLVGEWLRARRPGHALGLAIQAPTAGTQTRRLWHARSERLREDAVHRCPRRVHDEHPVRQKWGLLLLPGPVLQAPPAPRDAHRVHPGGARHRDARRPHRRGRGGAESLLAAGRGR